MFQVSSKGEIMDLWATKAPIELNTITFKCEYKIVVSHNLDRKVSVIRIISKPNSCPNATSAYCIDLLKR
ncbi:hypothetical protein D3C71_1618730 [compost metagenome]